MKSLKLFNKNFRRYSFLGILFLIFFFVFTATVRSDTLRSWDFDMTVKLQDRIPFSFDPFFSSLSILGRFEYTFIFLVIFLVVKRQIIGGILTIGIFGFAHIIEIIGKTTLNQPGPPRMFLRSQFSDFPGLHVFTEASYPSGHSMRTIFLTLLFVITIYHARKLPQNLKLAAYAFFIFLVGAILISRVSLGEHWATDVIGGSLLGASAAFLSLVLL